MTRLTNWWARLRARLLQTTPGSTPKPHQESTAPSRPASVKILVVVEGIWDIAFLKRISAILHQDDLRLPDLIALERRGELVFVPFGGGDFGAWPYRLAGLGLIEFHLYDRDVPPVSPLRHAAADLVNRRPHCRASVTKKRALENYLHTDALREARGVEIQFGDDDPVADVAAQAEYLRRGGAIPWRELTSRARKRQRNRAKQWLNAVAVDRMTVERLAARDSDGEVRGWLGTIAGLQADIP